MSCLAIKRESCRNVILRAILRHFSDLESDEPVRLHSTAGHNVRIILECEATHANPIAAR